uniref:Candidate secreted effector n=1 Tax=Meloidogyne incognita TaxID=6306 RepID=A0A914LLZ7_MELIC
MFFYPFLTPSWIVVALLLASVFVLVPCCKKKSKSKKKKNSKPTTSTISMTNSKIKKKKKDNSEYVKQLDKLKETEAMAISVESANSVSSTSESNPLSRETGQRTREKEMSLETTLELKEKLIKELEATKSGKDGKDKGQKSISITQMSTRTAIEFIPPKEKSVNEKSVKETQKSISAGNTSSAIQKSVEVGKGGGTRSVMISVRKKDDKESSKEKNEKEAEKVESEALLEEKETKSSSESDEKE